MEKEWIIVVSILSVTIGLIIFFVVRNHILTKRVMANSEIYHELLNLNQRTLFKSVSAELNYSHACKYKRQLDNYDFDKAFYNIVANNEVRFLSIVESLNFNIVLKKQYDVECKSILANCRTTKEQTKQFKVPIKSWQKIEENLYAKNLLKPTLEINIEVRATYTSPQGRNSYHWEKYYRKANIESVLTSIERERRFRLAKEKEEEEKIAARERRRAMQSESQKERSKLTKKLRYEILERDGYKCAICGRSATEHNIVLHVDHIIPVSKGGRTTPDNLQTLCEDCNLGKRDKMPQQQSS